ncbi:hypothetical protein LIP_0359 [Limnochorda pilosa]|uniref:UGSC-like domain-containing protein n=3 Tax=Limnochorda pilosa TaxID=1555112 RepID=A0A0K2SGI6_LIMPI|nr:hypothetical protein LIP_0359 [Limnochorda pilosa]
MVIVWVALAVTTVPVAFAAGGADVQTWQLVSPEGVVVVEPVEANPHPTTLEGRTIALFWNGKHNGDLFLTRVGELLMEQVEGVEIIRIWENHPETAGISGSVDKSKAKAAIVAGYKPDLVIASQCD